MILFFLPLNALTQTCSLKVWSWDVFLRPEILSDGQMDRVAGIGEYLICCGGDIVVQGVFHKRVRKRLLQKLGGWYEYHHTSIGPKSFFGISSG